MSNRIVPLLGLIAALSGCQIPPNDEPYACESITFANGVSVTNVTESRCALDYTSEFPGTTRKG